MRDVFYELSLKIGLVWFRFLINDIHLTFKPFLADEKIWVLFGIYIYVYDFSSLLLCRTWGSQTPCHHTALQLYQLVCSHLQVEQHGPAFVRVRKKEAKGIQTNKRETRQPEVLLVNPYEVCSLALHLHLTPGMWFVIQHFSSSVINTALTRASAQPELSLRGFKPRKVFWEQIICRVSALAFARADGCQPWQRERRVPRQSKKRKHRNHRKTRPNRLIVPQWAKGLCSALGHCSFNS